MDRADFYAKLQRNNDGARNIVTTSGTPSYNIGMDDHLTLIDTTLATSATLVLPSVSQAKGIYSIVKMDDNSHAVNIRDLNDSIDATGLEGLQLTAQFHNITLFSNGVKWCILSRHDANIDAGGEEQSLRIIVPAALGNAGATSGWLKAGADPGDLGEASLPASKTASTFMIPVIGLPLGSTVTGFTVVGQLESAGGTVTLDADMRKLTTAAADNVDASIGAITQISKTADYKIEDTKTLVAPEVLAIGEMLYVLLTGTTAASTDLKITCIVVDVTMP